MAYPVAMFTGAELGRMALIGLVLGLVMVASGLLVVLAFRPRYWVGSLAAAAAVGLGYVLGVAMAALTAVH